MRNTPENFTGELEAVKAAMAEAEDLLTEFAIEMRMRAKEARLRAEQLSEELREQQEPWPTNTSESH